MEIKDEIQIRIFHTLDKIQRLKSALEKHQSFPEPDKAAIAQYQEQKRRMTEELLILLRSIGAELSLAA